MSNPRSLDIPEWFKFVEDNFALTLEDVKSLPCDIPVELFFVDNSFLELCPEGENINIYHNLNCFNRGRYTRTNPDSLKGKFSWFDLETNRYKDEIDWEFDIKEYNTYMYYPLVNDKLNAHVEEVKWLQHENSEEYQALSNSCKHYNDIDEKSKVGWRGPMLILETVGMLPLMNND